jgi:hypothetical protein
LSIQATARPPLPDLHRESDLQGIPVRGILIGAVLAFFLNFLDAYATTMIRGSYLTLNFSTPAALFFFFFVVIGSGIVSLLRRPLALTRSELITIYVMLAVACSIPGMGFTQFMIPCMLGSTYYATTENQWELYYTQHAPQFMIPQGENVARFFFEGLPQGVPVPWEAWVVPISYWYGFFLVLSFAMICAMVLLRKQWAENEKLLYPLVQVPMEMIRKEKGGIIGGPFFSNRVMWAGFSFSFGLLTINGLHSYFPMFPAINKNFHLPLFHNFVGLDFWFSPPWTGFFYFVNLDISASIWIFYVITTLQRGVFNMIGLSSTQRIDFYSLEPYISHQGMGAMIVFVLVGLWVARRHLKEALHKALGIDESVDDSDEILSYRQAAYGLALSLVLVTVLLSMAGLPPVAAALFVFGAMVLFTALTRVVAEGGIPAMRPPIMTNSFVISSLGEEFVGVRGLVSLGFSYGWHSEIRSFVMSSVANGLKMAEVIVGSKRRLFWAVAIAVLVSLAGSSYITLILAYKHGGINLNPLFFVGQAPTFGPRDMTPRIAAAALAGPRYDALLFMGIGGMVMGALMWARHHLIWWPLNPLGYTISANWKTGHIFCSAFLAWALKFLILRYGGSRLFKQLKPFFLGLILGEIVAAGIWLVIDYLTGHVGSFLTQV